MHPHLVMDVGTGRLPGRAHERDLLPARHALPANDEDLGAVPVPRHHPVPVVDGDEVAEAFLPLDVSVVVRGGRGDRAAHRSGDVDALVRANDMEDRVHPRGSEWTRDAAASRLDRGGYGEARLIA